MNDKEYSKEQVIRIIENSFHAGICYGAAVAIFGEKYNRNTIIEMAKYLMKHV